MPKKNEVKNKKKVSDFEVMQQMSKDNLNIQACYKGNIKRISFCAKKGSEITIGVPNEIVNNEEKYLMAFYFVDKEEFNKTKKELEEGALGDK